MGKGQCGQCASEKRTMIAHNVKELENYIACDDETQSEIVIPVIMADGTLRTVLDIDSEDIGTFDQEDDEGLRKAISLIYQ